MPTYTFTTVVPSLNCNIIVVSAPSKLEAWKKLFNRFVNAKPEDIVGAQIQELLEMTVGDDDRLSNHIRNVTQRGTKLSDGILSDILERMEEWGLTNDVRVKIQESPHVE